MGCAVSVKDLIGLAELGILHQIGHGGRSPGEIRLHAEFVDVVLLRACSDHFCARRKCRFTQGVFGMKVGRYNINLRVFAGLAHFTKNRLAVSYAEPVSTTSVARLPTTMPTFGKPATLPSGIT